MSAWGIPFEFIQFGIKAANGAEPLRVFAKDNEGGVWVRVADDEWESLTEKDDNGQPKRLKRGLTAGELVKLMALNNTRIR